MKKISAFVFKFTFLISLLTPLTGAAVSLNDFRPNLFVVVVIDQFRPDYVSRFQERFLPARDAKGQVGGFNYLLQNAAYFPNTRYQIAGCMTAPGHATILTGSYPYLNGIISNQWFDPKTGELVYNTEDKTAAVIGGASSGPHDGTSPRLLNGTTVGDELKNAGYPARVVTVAIKDRGAILLGGQRADLAVWFLPNDFQWVTSRFYLPQGDLPEWLKTINRGLLNKGEAKTLWNLGKETTGFTQLGGFLMKGDKTVKAIGEQFPHSIEKGGALASPLGHEMTLEVARGAVESLKLGSQKTPDLLGVSLSSFDYVGHGFGPNRAELEEMVVQTDRQLAEFFNFLSKKVPGGLGKISLVLTSDHGVAPVPETLKENRIEAGRYDETDYAAFLEKHLVQRFGKTGDEKWVRNFFVTQYNLNIDLALRRKINPVELRAVARDYMSTLPRIKTAVSSDDIAAGRVPVGFLGAQLRKTYYPGRSADITLVVEPFSITNYGTANHMTGYNYDAFVPLFISGPQVQRGIYPQDVEVVDLASTLSFMAGVQRPVLAEGRVLHEIFAGKK